MSHHTLETLLDNIGRGLSSALRDALEGRELSREQALTVCRAAGPGLQTAALVADELRRRQCGETVTYVVNRNINFTNVCIKHCTFCAFSRDYRLAEGYFLPEEEILRRAREAAALGATEVCIQAGLPPQMDGRLYVNLTRVLKQELPDLHIHAFSPEEVLYGAIRSRVTVAEYLAELKSAGLGSLPGTSAEILVQDVRDRIAPGRITVKQWMEVITSAHALAIPTTATIMYGHVETPEDWVTHLEILRSIQRDTRGFTEFVPLSFVHQDAPMSRKVQGVRPGATGADIVRMHVLARLMLGPTFRNIQSSWVKEGPKMAQLLLSAGANDLGGTLMNESISTSAGAQYGQMVPPRELRRIIRDAGRIPAQRNTLYAVLREYEGEDSEVGPLDTIEDADARFGSYAALATSDKFRWGRTETSRAK